MLPLQGVTLGIGDTLDIPWLQSQSLAATIWKQRSPKYLKGAYRRVVESLFARACSDRTKDKGFKMKEDREIGCHLQPKIKM